MHIVHHFECSILDIPNTISLQLFSMACLFLSIQYTLCIIHFGEKVNTHTLRVADNRRHVTDHAEKIRHKRKKLMKIRKALHGEA